MALEGNRSTQKARELIASLLARREQKRGPQCCTPISPAAGEKSVSAICPGFSGVGNYNGNHVFNGRQFMN
jgi:hypothetical protein